MRLSLKTGHGQQLHITFTTALWRRQLWFNWYYLGHMVATASDRWLDYPRLCRELTPQAGHKRFTFMTVNLYEMNWLNSCTAAIIPVQRIYPLKLCCRRLWSTQQCQSHWVWTNKKANYTTAAIIGHDSSRDSKQHGWIWEEPTDVADDDVAANQSNKEINAPVFWCTNCQTRVYTSKLWWITMKK